MKKLLEQLEEAIYGNVYYNAGDGCVFGVHAAVGAVLKIIDSLIDENEGLKVQVSELKTDAVQANAELLAEVEQLKGELATAGQAVFNQAYRVR